MHVSPSQQSTKLLHTAKVLQGSVPVVVVFVFNLAGSLFSLLLPLTYDTKVVLDHSPDVDKQPLDI